MLLCSNALFVGRERHSIRASCTRLPMGPVIGDIGGDADPHKTVTIPHCLGPMAVLFTSVVGLAGWLLMMCARAIAWLRPSNSRMYLGCTYGPHQSTTNHCSISYNSVVAL